MAVLIEDRTAENLRLRMEFCRDHHGHGPEATGEDHATAVESAHDTANSEDTRSAESA